MEKIPAPAACPVAMLKLSYPGPITFYNGVRLGSRELLLLAGEFRGGTLARDVQVPGFFNNLIFLEPEWPLSQ